MQLRKWTEVFAVISTVSKEHLVLDLFEQAYWKYHLKFFFFFFWAYEETKVESPTAVSHRSVSFNKQSLNFGVSCHTGLKISAQI